MRTIRGHSSKVPARSEKRVDGAVGICEDGSVEEPDHDRRWVG